MKPLDHVCCCRYGSSPSKRQFRLLPTTSDNLQSRDAKTRKLSGLKIQVRLSIATNLQEYMFDQRPFANEFLYKHLTNSFKRSMQSNSCSNKVNHNENTYNRTFIKWWTNDLYIEELKWPIRHQNETRLL